MNLMYYLTTKNNVIFTFFFFFFFFLIYKTYAGKRLSNRIVHKKDLVWTRLTKLPWMSNLLIQNTKMMSNYVPKKKKFGTHSTFIGDNN